MSQILEKRNNPFAPNQVDDGMKQTVAASTLMQLYTNVILQTPDINLPIQVDNDSKSKVSTDLPKHQAIARENAEEYLDDINSSMLKTLSDIISYCNNWSGFYDQLQDLAKNIDKGDNEQQFRKIIDNFQKGADKREKKAGDVKKKLVEFQKKISADARNFEQDHQIVSSVLEGEGSELASLKEQINSLNSAITKDNQIIAAGAAGEIVGGLIIVVGVLGEFETFGATSALIGGGLLMLGSSGGIGVAVKDLSEKQKELKEKTIKLNQLDQMYTVVKSADQSIKDLETSVKSAISAVETLVNGWGYLKNDLNMVVESLDDLNEEDDNSMLTGELKGANKNWMDTHDLAVNLQLNGTIPVKKEDQTGERPRLVV